MADYTPITIIRGDSEVIDSTPIVDGQILFDSDRKCLYADVGNSRTKYSGLGADANIAEVEDTTTSSHVYVKGQYVIVQGEFYEVTAPISVGDTFAVGTNIAETTVGAELAQMNASFSQTLTDLKNTAIAQAVGVVASDTFAQAITKLGAIVNRGKVTQTLGLGQSYTIPQGYHNGQGAVSVNVTSQEKTITASRSQQIVTPDNGKVLSKVTVNKYPDASGNYPVTSNGTKDMGATNNYRYVDVNVPRGDLHVAVVISGQGDRTSFNCTVGDMLLVAGGAYSGIEGAVKVAGSGWTEWYRTTSTTVTWISYDGSITRIY